VFMPVFSVNNAMISILSFNYGARDRQRVTQAIRFGMLAAVTTALLGMGVVMLAASPLLLWCFRASADAWALGVPALRMTALSFPVAAVSIIWSAAFQSLGHSRYSLAVSLLRNLLFLLPAALVLVHIWPDGTFLAFFLGELAACLVTAFLYRSVRQNTILHI